MEVQCKIQMNTFLWLKPQNLHVCSDDILQNFGLCSAFCGRIWYVINIHWSYRGYVYYNLMWNPNLYEKRNIRSIQNTASLMCDIHNGIHCGIYNGIHYGIHNNINNDIHNVIHNGIMAVMTFIISVKMLTITWKWVWAI